MRRYYFHFLLFLLCAAPLHAATLDEIIVSAPTQASTGTESSASSIVAPRRTSNAYSSTADVLDAQTGVRVRQSGLSGQPANVSIRGSSAEQVAIMLDGVLLNHSALGGVDLASIPLSMIEKMEITRGSRRSALGAHAIGGVIHLKTARTKPGRQWNARLGGGSFWSSELSLGFREQRGAHRILTQFSHQHTRGNYRFRAAATDLAGGSIAGAGTFARENSASLSESLLAKYRFTGAQWQFDISNMLHYLDRELPGLEIETTQLAPSNPLEAEQRKIQNTTALTANYRPHNSAHEYAFGVHNQMVWDRFRDASPALGPAIARRSITNAINPFVKSTWAFRALGTHESTLRYDFRHDHFRDAALNDTTTAADTRNRYTYAVTASDTWSLASEHVQLTPSLHVKKANDFPMLINLGIGTLVRPHRTLQLRANIETAHRTPNFTELYHPDQGYIRGNPDLARERAWRWDAGLRGTWKLGQLDANYYQQHVGESILFVPISATTIAPINTAAVRIHGVEIDARSTPWPWLELSANYHWLRARFRSTGNQLPGRPSHQAHGRIALHRDFNAQWRGTLYTEVDWLSAVPVNVANTVFLAKRTTIDAGCSLRFKRNEQEYRAHFVGRNLSNVQRHDSRGFPLPLRSFAFSLEGRFG